MVWGVVPTLGDVKVLVVVACAAVVGVGVIQWQRRADRRDRLAEVWATVTDEV